MNDILDKMQALNQVMLSSAEVLHTDVAGYIPLFEVMDDLMEKLREEVDA